MSSIGLFDTSTQANESTRVASEWVRDEKLDRILKNPPKVTDGEVIAHKDRRSRSGVSRGTTQERVRIRGPFHAHGTLPHSQGTIPSVGPSPGFPRSP